MIIEVALMPEIFLKTVGEMDQNVLLKWVWCLKPFWKKVGKKIKMALKWIIGTLMSSIGTWVKHKIYATYLVNLNN